MPFDGIGFVGTKQTTTVWTRLRDITKGWLPAAKVAPPRVLAPSPVTQPDALTLQVLSIGRALIEDRKDWVQRRYETRDGRRCAVGALRGAARLMHLQGSQTGAHAFLLSVAMDRGFNDIESMNDNSSHRQVVSAFDEAIVRATAQFNVSRFAAG
jgi:hypothetical protein